MACAALPSRGAARLPLPASVLAAPVVAFTTRMRALSVSAPRARKATHGELRDVAAGRTRHVDGARRASGHAPRRRKQRRRRGPVGEAPDAGARHGDHRTWCARRRGQLCVSARGPGASRARPGGAARTRGQVQAADAVVRGVGYPQHVGSKAEPNAARRRKQRRGADAVGGAANARAGQRAHRGCAVRGAGRQRSERRGGGGKATGGDTCAPAGGQGVALARCATQQSAARHAARSSAACTPRRAVRRAGGMVTTAPCAAALWRARTQRERHA